LLPGPFDTDRYRGNIAVAAKAQGVSVEEVGRARAAANPAGRIGDPYEFGETCAFLCGKHAGFIVGQNLLMDGGGFNRSF
ncbi:MAG: hypothetical protein CFH40_02187, partial [Alphaproteobacteria bacterium MarineAlpha10_Bin3]